MSFLASLLATVIMTNLTISEMKVPVLTTSNCQSYCTTVPVQSSSVQRLKSFLLSKKSSISKWPS